MGDVETGPPVVSAVALPPSARTSISPRTAAACRPLADTTLTAPAAINCLTASSTASPNDGSSTIAALIANWTRCRASSLTRAAAGVLVAPPGEDGLPQACRPRPHAAGPGRRR
jgi:hypothetical protein